MGCGMGHGDEGDARFDWIVGWGMGMKVLQELIHTGDTTWGVNVMITLCLI